MAYSSAAQLQSNLPILAKTYSGTPLTTKCTAAIATADQIVDTDIGNVVDTTLIPAYDAVPAPVTPVYVNLLSQYKSAEIALVRMSGAHRSSKEVSDIDYWKDLYDKLLKKIISGEIDLVLSDDTSIGTGINTFTEDALPDVKPRFGYGKYGEWLDKDDLEDLRDTETGGY